MSIGINDFQPGRLIQVLAARRLSQLQLASMVGVSPATISKWKTGQQAPEAEALARLASVVNVSSEWFTRNLPTQTSYPLFRSNASAHVAAREMLNARLEWTQDITLGLSEFVDLPSLNLPSRNFSEPDEICHADIEDAASECRDLWRIGRVAVPDLALAAESAGIILVREETGITQIEGLSAWSHELKRPIVLLSADKDNGYRSRFDLAHELGHLILHKNIARVTNNQRYKLMEKQAHRFAGAFLLPAESFSTEVKTPVSLDSLLLLKQRWGVSVAAIIMRLEALGIIDEDMKMTLFKRRSARWGVRAEPNDSDRLPEQPRLLKRTVELLISSGVMPLTGIPRHIGLSPRDIEKIAGLPESYFDGQAEVIDLAKLRSTTSKLIETQSTGGTVLPFTRSTGKTS